MAKNMMESKILQVLQHIANMKLITWNILNRKNNESAIIDSSSFESFFEETFSFVIYFASLQHEQVSNHLRGVLTRDVKIMNHEH